MTPRSCSAPSHWKNSRRAVNIAAVWHPCAHACCSAALFSERTDTLMQWSVERRVCRVTQASPAKVGGARRDRTADLLHAMQALSQLSYGPICSRGNVADPGSSAGWLPRGAAVPRRASPFEERVFGTFPCGHQARREGFSRASERGVRWPRRGALRSAPPRPGAALHPGIFIDDATSS